VLPIVHFLESYHLASATSSGTSFEIRNIAGVSSILSYDRTNSLYKSVIYASDITLKYNGMML
jgi:hypothetical protein